MKVTSFGEVLWDDFPNGKVLGGAPLNVAVRLQSLGIDAAIISRRGDDADGEELLCQIQSKNVNTDYLQVCHECATSLVKVHLDKSGSASYEIVYPARGIGLRLMMRQSNVWQNPMLSFLAAWQPVMKFRVKAWLFC